MFCRFIPIAAASLLSTSAFAAEPAKAPQPAPAQQPHPAPAQVVLASAQEVQAPAPTEQQQAPAQPKRRVARVTTCRCGDQQAQPEQ